MLRGAQGKWDVVPRIVGARRQHFVTEMLAGGAEVEKYAGLQGGHEFAAISRPELGPLYPRSPKVALWFAAGGGKRENGLPRRGASHPPRARSPAVILTATNGGPPRDPRYQINSPSSSL
jgi:hypothetical protein